MVTSVSDTSRVLGAPKLTNWGLLGVLITILGLVCRSTLPGVGGGLAGHGQRRLGHFLRTSRSGLGQWGRCLTRRLLGTWGGLGNGEGMGHVGRLGRGGGLGHGKGLGRLVHGVDLGHVEGLAHVGRLGHGGGLGNWLACFPLTEGWQIYGKTVLDKHRKGFFSLVLLSEGWEM